MNTRLFYTAAFASLLWLHTTSCPLFAVETNPFTQAKNLKTIFKSIEDRRLSLLEAGVTEDSNAGEYYFADMEFSNTKDMSGLESVAKNKVHYEYDNDLNKVAVDIQYWDNDKRVWVKHLRELSLYGDNGALREEKYQTWSDEKAEWTSICREVFVYDRNDNLTQADMQWQEQNGTWSNLSRDNYHYNSDGYFVEKIVQLWNPQTKSWGNASRHAVEYDREGYEIEKTNQTNVGKKEWQNSRRVVYDYATDPEQKRTEVTAIQQKWNNHYWVNTSRKMDMNDDISHQSESISQRWNNNTAIWDNEYRQLKTYSDGGHISSVENYYWNTELGTWENATRTLHIYDEKNRLSEVTDQQWNGESQQGWANTAHTKLSYASEVTLDNP